MFKNYFALLIGSVLYFLLAKFGMSFFSIQPHNISLIWLPFGLGVILVDKYGMKASAFIFLASFFAHFDIATDLHTSALIHKIFPSLADAFAPVLSLFFTKKFLKHKLNNLSTLLPFTFWGGIVPTSLSGIVITLNWVIAGDIPNNEIINFIILLVFSDTMGFILLYPMFQFFDNRTITRHESYLIARDILIATLIITASLYYQFLIFLLYPALLISAYKLRTKYLLILLTIVTLTAMIILNLFGIHLFSYQQHMNSILMVGSFLTTLVFIIIGISLHNKELEYNKYLSRTDNLTTTLNRNAYDQKIEELFKEFSRYRHHFSIILLDIDNFKSINDTLGHQEGDKVLIALSNLISEHIRENDFLYRIGGEEFIVLLPHTPLPHAQIVAEKIRTLIEQNLKCCDGKVITASLGVTQVEEEDTKETLFARVDQFLYYAKQHAKNQVCSKIF